MARAAAMGSAGWLWAAAGLQLAWLGLPEPVGAKQVVISNVEPRRNVTGDIMDAHDGSYNQWQPGGDFYYYAMGYGTCQQGGDMCHGCGYGYSWIGVWRSPDMSNGSWTLLRDARDNTWPHCTYFRVHVVYCKKTANYVLWVNLNGGPADYAIGTSSTPDGPFTFVHAIDVGRPGGGDFDILVDDDGTGYIIYTSTSMGHTMAVERLTDDYLRSAATAPPPPTIPPSPPSPLPPGFTMLGHGSCRDALNKEPDFETNEPARRVNSTLLSCAAACSAAEGCGGFSFCDGNVGCNGACHVYLTAEAPALPEPTWHWKTFGGGHLPVTQVTQGETWWTCLAKSSVEKPLASASEVVAPSNVSSGVFGNVFVEAPVIFKRKGVYYALFGNCCCFCGHGSGIGVYTALNPLGPWVYHDNVGCTANTSLTPGCGCGMAHSIPGGGKCNFYGDSLTKAQQNFVIQIPQSDGSTQLVWTGDRWQSAKDGIKAHDLQYWSVLQWSTTSYSGDIELPLQFVWENSISINV